MTAEVRLVDADELRRRIDGAIASGPGPGMVRRNTDGTPWSDGRRYGLRIARGHLDAMPSVTAPKGWTRDEVLAALAEHPDNVCEYEDTYTGKWEPYEHIRAHKWHPEVRRYDVRVVRVAPEPEWVPLTQLVGRTIHGCHAPVSYQPVHHTGQWWWQGPGGATHAFPEGTLNLETGQVAVRPKAAS